MKDLMLKGEHDINSKACSSLVGDTTHAYKIYLINVVPYSNSQ